MTKEVLSSLTQLEINFCERLHGGDINDVFLIQTDNDSYCIKFNKGHEGAAILESEIHGLNLLKSYNHNVPKIVDAKLTDQVSFICMNYYPTLPPNSNFWKNFANQLVQLHHTTNSTFGLQQDNHIGSLKQVNKENSSWSSFYLEQRLIPQFELLAITASLPKHWLSACKNISESFPTEQPSLLHGDLWSGNYICSRDSALFIDPAVYFGHREMDLGMMLLFGGFDPSLFDYYEDLFPLEKGWKQRIPLTQLYPLLVHANLFGGSYISRVFEIIDRYR